MEMGRDNLDFEGSQDQKNFKAWRDLATGNT
jgi:phenol hydroxylase P3 protein